MNRLETAHEFKRGALAGLISATMMYLFIEVFSWLDIIKFGQSYLSGETVFTYKNEMFIKIISFFITLAIGIFWGIVLAFLFTKVFTDELVILKGIAFSFVIFVFHLGILDESFHYNREIHKGTFNLLIILFGYLIFGSLSSVILKRLGIFNDKKTTKKDEKITEKQTASYIPVPAPSMKKQTKKTIHVVKPKKL